MANTPTPFPPRATGRLILIGGILLIAACLRTPVTSVAPIVTQIRESFALSTAAAGALTTLPLLAFALVSPLAAQLARRQGIEKALFAALAVMIAGALLRAIDQIACVYLGTFVLGAGIAVGNVLLPSLLKRDFPGRIAAMTAAYVVVMGMVAALGSACIVPLTEALQGNWRLSLVLLSTLPLLAMLCWLPQITTHRHTGGPGAAGILHRGRIWRSPLAWQVTLFLGMNSFIYYIAVGWLPAMITETGYSAAYAGSLHGLMQLATAVPGLLLAPVIARMKDQRLLACATGLVTLLSLAGLALWLAGVVVWTVLLGVGTGAAMILGLAFISLRAAESHQAAALSGMAQCVGYLLAAVGPMLMGALHDLAGSWYWPLLICSLCAGIMGLLGFLCGADRQIGVHRNRTGHDREPGR
ncbi:CynX/NimT family MFS transporter [Sodalis endosymbiont of Spalangia cameroni]|uniref:CynX/NimT family MFS transporter n=1 Tax=Sodalis praecaptivus TaxID=1239307 RepID=UPI0031F750E4